MSSVIVNVFVDKLRSLNLEGPSGFGLPNVIPPDGPSPGVARICGEDIECFKPLLCSIVGTEGDASGSSENLFAGPVLRLSKLGFFLALRGGGLINEGDEGSDVCCGSELGLSELRFKARLLGFLNFLGDGEVIGLS